MHARNILSGLWYLHKLDRSQLTLRLLGNMFVQFISIFLNNMKRQFYNIKNYFCVKFVTRIHDL